MLVNFKVGQALDHVFALIDSVLLSLNATNPIGWAIEGIGSVVGLTLRILAAKAENRAWHDFYHQTQNEERRMRVELEKILATANKIVEQWTRLR